MPGAIACVGQGGPEMAPRRLDRWWMLGIAFIAAAAMVLLVLLTTSDQATGATRAATSTPSHASGQSAFRDEVRTLCGDRTPSAATQPVRHPMRRPVLPSSQDPDRRDGRPVA